MSHPKQTLQQRRDEIDALIAKWTKLYGTVTYGSQTPKEPPPKPEDEKR